MEGTKGFVTTEGRARPRGFFGISAVDMRGRAASRAKLVDAVTVEDPTEEASDDFGPPIDGLALAPPVLGILGSAGFLIGLLFAAASCLSSLARSSFSVVDSFLGDRRVSFDVEAEEARTVKSSLAIGAGGLIDSLRGGASFECIPGVAIPAISARDPKTTSCSSTVGWEEGRLGRERFAPVSRAEYGDERSEDTGVMRGWA